MNELHFETAVDKLFLKIERALEQTDVDFETQEGMLTITFAHHQQMILSRQTALQEIWLAAPLGAYHFKQHHKQWITAKGETLDGVCRDIFAHYLGESIDIHSFLDED